MGIQREREGNRRKSTTCRDNYQQHTTYAHLWVEVQQRTYSNIGHIDTYATSDVAKRKIKRERRKAER